MNRTSSAPQSWSAQSWSTRARESLVAILAEAPAPWSTSQLSAAHGEFGQRIYVQLRALEKAGQLVRLPVPPGTRSVWWWLAGRPYGVCEVCGARPGGDRPGRWRFIPPAMREVDVLDEAGRLVWRDCVEIAGPGWWACLAHAGPLWGQRIRQQQDQTRAEVA